MMKNYSVKIIVLKIIENSFEALFFFENESCEMGFSDIISLHCALVCHNSRFGFN